MKIKAIILFSLLIAGMACAEQPSTLVNPNALKIAVSEPGYTGVFIIFQNETGAWVVGYTVPERDTKIYLGNETGYVIIQNNQTNA